MMSSYYRVCILFVWQVEEFSNTAKSIERFIEGRASFSRKIWLVAHPLLLPPPPPVCKLDRRHTERLGKRDNLLTGGGGG